VNSEPSEHKDQEGLAWCKLLGAGLPYKTLVTDFSGTRVDQDLVKTAVRK
jgi:hypothetical protein